MKFTMSTKPFADALNLGIINGNISKFYSKSCIAQLTASKHELKVNLEANSVYTEMLLKGSGDEDTAVTTFVDCLLLKQLVGTLDTATITIEFVDGGVTIHSGSSKFSLPKSVQLDGQEYSLKAPTLPEAGSPAVQISKTDWKFIADYQMYAIATSFVYPIYTRVWVGEDGTVLIGDFSQQMFTTSKKSPLGKTCLIEETIVNLFNAVPENATLSQVGNNYVIHVKTDGFEYAAEFCPLYEADEGVGSYKSDVILDAMDPDTTNCFKISVPAVTKTLNQADLLSSGDDSIQFSLEGTDLRVKAENVDVKIPVEGTCNPFKIDFKMSLIKPLMSNIDEEVVTISPVVDESGLAAGIVAWTKSLRVMLGGQE